METYENSKNSNHTQDRLADNAENEFKKYMLDIYSKRAEAHRLEARRIDELAEYYREEWNEDFTYGKQYKILTELEFNYHTDIDGVMTPQAYISQHNLFYRKNWKNNKRIWLEYKQTHNVKMFSAMNMALEAGGIDYIYEGNNSKERMWINGLKTELTEIIKIAVNEPIVVALTHDSTTIHEGFYTKFYEYDYTQKKFIFKAEGRNTKQFTTILNDLTDKF